MFTVNHLTCEYAVNPLGIETDRPRLGWRLSHGRRGQTQSAYQVLVASMPQLLEPGQCDLWDSGKVNSNHQCQVEYAGAALSSRQQCWWKVRVWDAAGQASDWSEPACFEVGLLRQEEWVGEWLGYPAGWTGRALYFRCPLRIGKPLRRARAYVAGLGLHEMRANGAKVGSSVLDPAPTVYARRVLYVVHDLTGHLHEGDNALGVILGNGWLGTGKLLVQIYLDYADGTTECLATQRSDADAWKVAAGGIVSHGLFDGETFDARLEDPHWDTPQYDRPGDGRAMRWTMACAVDSPGGKLHAQTAEPIQVVRTVAAVATRQVGPGAWVLDMGQNLAGWARLRVAAPRGTTVTMRFAESIHADGTVNQENLYVAAATDRYTCRGGQVEQYEPRFTYHGFRYVQVEGLPQPPGPETVVACVVRSAASPRGRFASDNDMLNRVHRAVVATEESNLHGVPTDCPQRAERMGWLNDMTARSEQAILNFDLARFYGKFARDIADAQGPDGAVPDTVPFRWGYRLADPVAIAPLLLPWLLYCHYGDRRVLASGYPTMKAWTECLRRLCRDGILSFSRWGDWAEPSGDPCRPRHAVSQRTPGALVSTAFFFRHAQLLSRIAGVLGKRGDAREYRRLANQTADAFNERFWDSAAGVYGTGSQACCAIPLWMGLVPPGRVAAVLDRLVQDVQREGVHLTTGNIATKFVPEVLSAHGRGDLALALATQTSYPSWGFMLANGATTIWERWEHATGGDMNSHNHPMLGSIGAWMYKHAAGLDVAEDAVGADKLTMTPRPLPGLTQASAELDTVLGRAALDWRQEGDELIVRGDVPFGATAELRLPARPATSILLDGQPLEGGPGRSLPEGVLNMRRRGGIARVSLAGGSYEIRCSLRHPEHCPPG